MKDHTQVAARIRDGALDLFQKAHDQLVEANQRLTEGIDSDNDEKERLQGRIADAAEQKQANDRVVAKLKEFVA